MTVTGVGPEFPYLPPPAAALPVPGGDDHLLLADDALEWKSTKLVGRVDPNDDAIVQIQKPDGTWDDVFSFGHPEHWHHANPRPSAHSNDNSWHEAVGMIQIPVKVGVKYFVTAYANILWMNQSLAGTYHSLGVRMKVDGTQVHRIDWQSAMLSGVYSHGFVWTAAATSMAVTVEWGANDANMDSWSENSRVDIVEMR